jgi:rubrerythrin
MMLNKEDYLKYLDQMNDIERNMIGVYSECADLAQNEEIKNIFLKLVDDEKRHSRMVIALKNFFD